MAQKRSYNFEEIEERSERERGGGVRDQRDVADFQTSRKPYSCRRTGSFECVFREILTYSLRFVSSGVQLALSSRMIDRSRGFCQPRRLTSGRGRGSNTATWRFADIWRPRGGLWKGLRSRLDGYFRCVFRTAGTCISAAHVHRWLLIAPSSTFQQPTVNFVFHFEYVSLRKFLPILFSFSAMQDIFKFVLFCFFIFFR